MRRKLAVKRLTESDLTIFEFHHRRTKGKQKAINLNADVLVGELYPQLPEFASSRNGRLPVDLYLYGPAHSGEYNLQRKILKLGTYKNWRLDGEFIHDPPSEPHRFDDMRAGDFAVFDFVGDMSPETCKVVFVSQLDDRDKSLHHEIAGFLGERRMARITEPVLEVIVERAGIAPEHPIHRLLLEASLEDAVFSGEAGTTELLRQPNTRSVSRSDLDNARRSAEEAGDLGEAFVNAYLAQEQTDGRIDAFQWVSQANAVSPFDFTITEADGTVEVDAKATAGEFKRRIHLSISELKRAASGQARYDIYRVYEMRESTAQMRICRDLKEFARQVIQGVSSIPAGTSIDCVSIDPDVLAFGPPINVTLEEFDE